MKKHLTEDVTLASEEKLAPPKDNSSTLKVWI